MLRGSRFPASALQEGLTISGRLAFEMDGVDAPTMMTRARLNLLPGENSAFMMGTATTEVSASGAFTMSGVVPGRYRVNATFNTPEVNWILKSAVIKGRDALDVPFDLAPGDVVTDALFTFTNRTQELLSASAGCVKAARAGFHGGRVSC